MKYTLCLFVSVIAMGLMAFQPLAGDQLLPTKLRVTVLDGLGNFQQGATVSLYESEDAYRSNGKPVAQDKTDEKGRVTFKDLKTISYFIDARKGDMNNDGEGVVTAPLDEGKLNKVNTVIE